MTINSLEIAIDCTHFHHGGDGRKVFVRYLHFAIDWQASRMPASPTGCFSCSLPKRIRKFDGYLEDKMNCLYECTYDKKIEEAQRHAQVF